MRIDVTTARHAELDIVCALLSEARAWHLRNTPEAWPVFERDAVARDIRAGRVFLARDPQSGAALGTVTLTEEDPLIWGDDALPCFYIHKLASLRALAGRGIGAGLIDWAVRKGRQSAKRALRLDTWATNAGLKRYYETRGFHHVGVKSFPPDSPLPAHYRGASMNLFERRIAADRDARLPARLLQAGA